MKSAGALIISFAAAGLVAGLQLATAAEHGKQVQQKTSAEALFDRNCGICHAPGGTGTMMLARRLGEDNALLEGRTDLQPVFIRTVVRKGIGSMPLFTRVEVTDAQLELIAGYLAGSPGAGD